MKERKYYYELLEVHEGPLFLAPITIESLGCQEGLLNTTYELNVTPERDLEYLTLFAEFISSEDVIIDRDTQTMNDLSKNETYRIIFTVDSNTEISNCRLDHDKAYYPETPMTSSCTGNCTTTNDNAHDVQTFDEFMSNINQDEIIRGGASIILLVLFFIILHKAKKN